MMWIIDVAMGFALGYLYAFLKYKITPKSEVKLCSLFRLLFGEPRRNRKSYKFISYKKKELDLITKQEMENREEKEPGK